MASAAGRIDVMMCVDDRYALPLAVTLASLEQSTADDGEVVVHVFHSGLSSDEMTRVAAPLKKLELRWYRIDAASVDGAHYPPWISPATLFRLHLGELLPAGIGRVLYLDADVVVRRPLDDAFAAPLDDGALLAAVRDGGCPWAARNRFPCWQELGMEPDTPYFNAGLLVIDVERWKSERVGERCLEILRTTQPYFADQDALNAVVAGRWHELLRRWNLQTVDVRGGEAWALWPEETSAAVADPAVVHYTESDKPWQPLTGHPLKDYWIEAVRYTDWSDWTPPPGRSGSPLVNRVLSAARRLRAQRDARLSRQEW
ncbi:general stress protein A [Luteimicrobium album]|uniref:General stress protein A n=2 Tax=Luteimicrobium album TaxID=1054550 RepID=A0ABQ6I414_9MICO|nr:general stress protein A [Luteimicrobium album]